MEIQSSAFHDSGTIPDKYAHQRENVSPPLAWSDVPPNTKSLALIVDDPDAPSGDFVHWLVYDIPPHLTHLPEGAGSAKPGDGVRQGRNSFGDIGYDGPQPPSGTHRYVFHLYALDQMIKIAPGVSRRQLDQAIRGHILSECRLTGKFSHH